MSYGYFRTESPEGIDYSFYSTQTGRIYVVSFEMSLYVEYADSLPTLVKHGYGLLFKYQKTQDFQKGDGKSNIDDQARETIADIIKDFLESQNAKCFVVYECHDFKHEKFFSNWYTKFSEGSGLRYTTEFTYRYNNRQEKPVVKFNDAIGLAANAVLTYNKLTGKLDAPPPQNQPIAE